MLQTLENIQAYIDAQPTAKKEDMKILHQLILTLLPNGKLWFLEGKDEQGKVVSNPNIGYGHQNLPYADGASKDFYQIGMSANTTGISIYIIGLKNKQYLKDTYDKQIGKATITGYCIKFKSLQAIHLNILKEAIKDGIAQTSK